MAQVTRLTVNGTVRQLNVAEEASLLNVLRDELELTGAKYGCGEGRCGACTVLVDGEPARSCLVRIGVVADKPITTIEGLAHDGHLHPLQEAFLKVGALQCGYCTPGMIMASVALLAKNPEPTPSTIVRALEGNLCRCGIYTRILAAVQQAAAMLKGGAQ